MSDKNSHIELLLSPFSRFLRIETSGGILLILFTLVALVWANSPYSIYYQQLWENELSFGLGDGKISKSILHWINDGLMAVFFFVVGLEIKREVRAGELSAPRQAMLPVFAAIGGMVFPAIFYTLLNQNPQTAAGWGIPMATDIAFSLGVLSLLGSRVPISLKVFLVAFAIVDDLGAVIIIAVFYSHDVQSVFLLYAAIGLVLLLLFNRLNIRFIPLYLLSGLFLWYMFLKSGLHPTLAGVLIALAIPVNRKTRTGSFRRKMNRELQAFPEFDCEDKLLLSKDQIKAIDNMHAYIRGVESPLQSLEHHLHNFVTFFVMPLFALTNAGVVFGNARLVDFFSELSFTIELSLIFGKVVGIFLLTWIGVTLRLAVLPEGVGWPHILGLGFLGGMGFTMSLFISNLAFGSGIYLNPAKLGILLGSLLAGIIGYIVLRMTLKKE